MILFDESSIRKKSNINIESPIRQQIRAVEEKLKNRLLNKNFQRKPMKVNDEKRARFMDTSMNSEHHQETNNDRGCKSKNTRFPIANISPEVVKLLPRIPMFDCKLKNHAQLKEIAEFSMSHSDRKKNSKSVYVDPSLPNVDDILNDLKIKQNYENPRNAMSVTKSNVETKENNGEIAESLSEIRRSYRAVISNKLERNKEDPKVERLEDQKQSISTPSSTSTNSSYDSDDERNSENGSENELKVEFNGIPISQKQMKKFRVLN